MSNIVLLNRQNKFAFPNRNPGFDTSHLASGVAVPNSGDSVIASGATMVSLLKAAPYVRSGSPVAAMISGLGPCVNFTGTSGQLVSLSGQNTANNTGITMAVIVQMNSITGFSGFCSNGNAGGSSTVIGQNAGVISFFDTVLRSSGLSIVINVPYFIAVSSHAVTGSTNYYILNLATGAVLSTSAAAASQIRASTGSFYFGNNGSATTQTMNGYMAAGVIIHNNPLSLTQLALWGANFWAFWYPFTVIDTMNCLIQALPLPGAFFVFNQILTQNFGGPVSVTVTVT